MCDARPSRGYGTVRQPRWGQLYGIVAVGLALLGGVDALGPGEPTRTLLRVVLVLGSFAAMAYWLRRQRAARDLLAWCDCAAERMTVRVIPSSAPVVDGVSEADLDIPPHVPAEVGDGRRLDIGPEGVREVPGRRRAVLVTPRSGRRVDDRGAG